jgi:hypothetical protein
MATVASHANPPWSSVTSGWRSRMIQALWQASSIVCSGAWALAATVRRSRWAWRP